MTRPSTVVLAAVLVVARGPAFGGFTDRPAVQSMTLTSGSLAAPSSLTATAGCVGLLNAKVTLSWTATPTTWATGYVIERTVLGTTTLISVSGRDMTSYVDSGRPLLTAHSYVVRASYQLWRSPASNTASATTPALC